VLGAWRALDFDGLRASTAVGTDVMRAVAVPAGGGIIALVVAIAVLSSMNATMIVGARSNHAVGGDWRAFSWLDGWDLQRSVPAPALLTQAGISLLLIAFGATEKSGFEAMVEFTAPVFWFFLLLATLALPILRRREPAAARPFRVPLYPLLPLVAVGTTAYLFYSSVAYAQSQRAVHVSLYVMAGGVLAWGYALARERRARRQES
jgi:amino acid transporter